MYIHIYIYIYIFDVRVRCLCETSHRLARNALGRVPLHLRFTLDFTLLHYTIAPA